MFALRPFEQPLGHSSQVLIGCLCCRGTRDAVTSHWSAAPRIHKCDDSRTQVSTHHESRTRSRVNAVATPQRPLAPAATADIDGLDRRQEKST